MASVLETRKLFDTLQPGDLIEIEHVVKVGMKSWTAVTRGEVVKTRRRRHGLHFRRAVDDKVYSDEILLKRDAGELTTLTLDEYTVLRKV